MAGEERVRVEVDGEKVYICLVRWWYVRRVVVESVGSAIRRRVVSGRGAIVGRMFSVVVVGVCGVIIVFVEGMGCFVMFV